MTKHTQKKWAARVREWRVSGLSAPPSPRLLPVRVRELVPAAADVVVEVGGARIRVTRGDDLALVGDVVRALQGGVR